MKADDISVRVQTLLEERSAPDDVARAAYQEANLVVVLRLRLERGRRVFIVDDGTEQVETEVLDYAEVLDYILPPHTEAETVGYEAARDAIVRAFAERKQ